MTEELTYTGNQDGTISIKVDGKDTRYAKESDLLTVKGAADTAKTGFETAIAKSNTSLLEANRLHDETRQKLLQETAAKEQLVTQAGEADTLKTKVGELETSLTTANTSRTELEEELLGMKRISFQTIYKADPEKVKEMTLVQIRDAEKSFQAVGFNPANPKPANYDGGGGGNNAGNKPATVLEQCANELTVAREQKAKRAAGTDSDDKP